MHILNPPFGDLLTEEGTKALLTDFHMSGFIQWRTEPVTFRSSMESHVLIGGRQDLTEHPLVLQKVGNLIAKAAHVIAAGRGEPCLIGLPMVGNTLAAAASVSGSLPFYVMRQARKDHGAHKTWVDGSPWSDYSFITIDNTITDGESKFEMMKRLAHDGFNILDLSHLILVDRGIGASERMRGLGYRFFPLFTLPTLARAFVTHGHWSRDKYEKVLEENSRYRLAP